jgi:hypothetical protein
MLHFSTQYNEHKQFLGIMRGTGVRYLRMSEVGKQHNMCFLAT